MSEEKQSLRLAALADLHYSAKSHGALQDVFSQISAAADVFLLCGDLTDAGLPQEAEVLVKDLSTYVKIPMVAVLGNHDYETGHQDQVKELLVSVGVRVLDGTFCEIAGVGFAGVKGFAGGFGRVALQPWGETAIKHFVQEAVNEAAKLESALAGLQTGQRVVLLHYAPIRTTVVGENIEIFPFLGSSRLEEPINQFKPAAVFHGHAHGGNPEGRTGSGVPVYNASQAVLRRAFPEKPPFRLIEVRVERGAYA
jgi:Icc-related predicted phosphoesterase